jgi:type III pantothenate kinase
VRPDLVADVGNSRVKWGIVSTDGSSITQVIALPDDPDAWTQALACVSHSGHCVLASVRPERSERLAAWLRDQGWTVCLLQDPAELPLRCAVVEPRRVGIDRLLNAVAARRRLHPGEPAVLVDAGSAVTVDWLDETQTFRGGTIFPGLRLMAEALHAYTAFLPLVTVGDPIPELPATDTRPAMEAGIFHTVAGGIERITVQLGQKTVVPARVFLTGGDAPLLASRLSLPGVLWPEMTLEGILASAEAIPG